jgi:hypothetical protein
MSTSPQEIVPRENSRQDNTACWVVWGTSRDTQESLVQTVDHALQGFFFYPEMEWAQFGYRPPVGEEGPKNNK